MKSNPSAEKPTTTTVETPPTEPAPPAEQTPPIEETTPTVETPPVEQTPPDFTSHLLKSGGYQLVIGNFTFWQKRISKTTIKFRCTKYKSGCTAVCDTNIEMTKLMSLPTEHNHEPPVDSTSPPLEPPPPTAPLPPTETSPPVDSLPPVDDLPPSDTLPAMKLSLSRKKKQTLIINGFTFLHIGAAGSGHRWRCAHNKQGCKSTVKSNAAMDRLLTTPGAHNHGMCFVLMYFFIYVFILSDFK